MTDKQTQCPDCNTTYKVSVTQLTVSQGMVCCAKCATNFNALLNLVENTPQPKETVQETQNSIERSENLQSSYEAESHVLDIFNRKIENSNINLRTYLNSLNQFNNDPVNNIPSLHLSSKTEKGGRFQTRSKSLWYYVIWGLVNFALISVLVFQVLWFNPNLTDKYPLLSSLFTKTCAILHCDTVDQRYNQMKIETIHVEKVDKESTQFSGVMVNNYKKSLALPLLKLTLTSQGQEQLPIIIPSTEYIGGGLSGISRIPTARPYRFKFTIPQPRNSFDDYHLEIIHP